MHIHIHYPTKVMEKKIEQHLEAKKVKIGKLAQDCKGVTEYLKCCTYVLLRRKKS